MRSQLDYLCASGRGKRARRDNEPTIRLFRKLREDALDVSGVTHAYPDTVTPRAEEEDCANTHERNICSDLGNVDESYAAHRGRDLLEDAHPFPTERRLVIREPSNIPARTRQACNVAAANRI